MDLLEQLFEVYEKANKIPVTKVPQLSDKKAEFGDVIEICFQNQMFVAVVIDENTAILMSDFWEFATNTDMVVNFDHVVANKWIVEVDKRMYLEPLVIYNIVGSLSTNDIKILEKVLDGRPIPPEKSGPKVPLNKKDPRYKFKMEELKKTMMINQWLFIEKT
jgi:hypothetical protein